MNPITVSIIYDSGTPVTNTYFCLHSNEAYFPLSGANLEATCPPGSYGSVSNTSQIVLNTTKSIMDTTQSTNETFTASIYVKPTNGGGFIVTIPDNNQLQDFEIIYSGKQCLNNGSIEYYPVGPDGNECQEIPTLDLNNSAEFSLDAGQTKYFKTIVPISDYSRNAIYVFYNQSNDIKLLSQSGYYPTSDWYMTTYDEEYSNNLASSRILTPATFSENEVFYFSLTNTGDSKLTVGYNITSSSCDSIVTFGNNCGHSIQNNVDPVAGVFLISGKLVNLTITNTTLSNNDGSAFSFDYNDDSYEGDYAYFTISEYPVFPTPYYIRVSVANNDVTDEDGAPAIFAKRGGYPSEQSNNYNTSYVGDVSNQFLIKIEAEDLIKPIEANTTWYFAVKLPSDFSIWVGSNCAGNCDNQLYGYCMCNDRACQNSTENFSNTSGFYEKPTSLLDSAGACNCYDDDYDSSFNCSELNNPNFWIWITLLCITITLVIVVGIGVPLLCYLTNNKKKKADFETM